MLGAAVLVVLHNDNRAISARDNPAEPLTVEQAVTTTVGAALEISADADLLAPTGAYAVQSCSAAGGGPHRVVVNLNFAVPQGNPPRYLDGVAAAMLRSGWSDAAAAAPHFGRKLTRAGVTSTFFRNGDRTDLATMTIDGECRVTTDDADPAWIDLTDRLRSGR